MSIYVNVNFICTISLLYLNSGKHGVGRIDIVENRFIGMKSRGTEHILLLHLVVVFLAHHLPFNLTRPLPAQRAEAEFTNAPIDVAVQTSERLYLNPFIPQFSFKKNEAQCFQEMSVKV